VCGIAGRYNFLSGAPADPVMVRRMCDSVAHRGPDGEGVHADGPLALGHRRLSIIDLTDAGCQPMSRDAGRYWIVFNGEIYNFTTLREELEGLGFPFSSRTDTEVVLAAYQAWGPDFLQRLRGMFALAIWDGPARRLLLARDRVGKKPLSYLVDKNGLAFASEARALLADPAVAPQPNPSVLLQYLAFQYVPSPSSAFCGVEKLPPAHYLLVEDGKLTCRRYWRLRYEPKRSITEEDAEAELYDRLREAVKIRLMSDVPLGAFLSGGIDSGTVVALMAEVGPRVKTFSIGFEEPEYNELAYARVVARQYDTEHHEFVVRPEAATVLERLVWHYSEPYADSSAIPTFYLAQLTRPHVTVALNGDGGDESFAGYDRYLAQALVSRFDRMPQLLRASVAGVLGLVPAVGGPKARSVRIRRLAAALPLPSAARYAHWTLQFTRELRERLCTPDFLAAATGPDAERLILDRYRESDASNLLEATLDVDVQTYLPDDLLVKVDVATMAHGLEGRSPLLDQDVMQFAASLPPEMKIKGRTTKYLLKRLARRLLPAELIDRPKMGFAVPLDHWFRKELKGMARDLLLDARARGRGYFNTAFVEQMLDEHATGQRLWHQHLWTLLMFEIWHRTFIDGAGRRP